MSPESMQHINLYLETDRLFGVYLVVMAITNKYERAAIAEPSRNYAGDSRAFRIEAGTKPASEMLVQIETEMVPVE